MERGRHSEKAGLYLNLGKTTVMTTGDIGEVTLGGKDNIEVVMHFFLGSADYLDGLCEKEVRRRIAMGQVAMGGLTSIWKDRGVTLDTKVKLVKVLVFPIILYGAETWTMRKHIVTIKGALYRIQIICRRYTLWSYPTGLTIADPPG